MQDSDSTDTMFLSGAAGLARILAQDQPETALWEPEEMRAIPAALLMNMVSVESWSCISLELCGVDLLLLTLIRQQFVEK